jgi:uncharacterized repeat protein (TIGR02543 family)
VPGTTNNYVSDFTWQIDYSASGIYTVVITASASHQDSSGTITTESTFNFLMEVNNTIPTPNAGGTYTVARGIDGLTLNGSAPDPGTGADETYAYSWDLNGDGNFTDASGLTPTLTWNQLAALWPATSGPMPGNYTITLKVAATMINYPYTVDFRTGTATLTITPTYTLTTAVNIPGSGSVARDPAPINGLYRPGTAVRLTATANNGYHLVGWQIVNGGQATGSVNPLTVTMDANKTVTAIFSNKALYTVTVNTVGSGNVTKFPDQAGYESGTQVQLTATANPGYFFTGWSEDATGVANPVTITVTKSMLVTATFTQVFPVTITKIGSGTVGITAQPASPQPNDGTSGCPKSPLEE